MANENNENNAGKQTRSLPPEVAGILGQLPRGTKVEHPAPHFPPGLAKALTEARKSNERYIVAVWTVTVKPDGGTVTHLHVTRGGGFMFEWLLRAFKLFERQTLAVDLPPDEPVPAENPTGESDDSAPPVDAPKGYE